MFFMAAYKSCFPDDELDIVLTAHPAWKKQSTRSGACLRLSLKIFNIHTRSLELLLLRLPSDAFKNSVVPVPELPRNIYYQPRIERGLPVSTYETTMPGHIIGTDQEVVENGERDFLHFWMEVSKLRVCTKAILMGRYANSFASTYGKYWPMEDSAYPIDFMFQEKGNKYRDTWRKYCLRSFQVPKCKETVAPEWYILGTGLGFSPVERMIYVYTNTT